MRFLTELRPNTINQTLKQALLLGTIHFKPLCTVVSSYGFKIPCVVKNTVPLYSSHQSFMLLFQLGI